jgi:hypothetical protein
MTRRALVASLLLCFVACFVACSDEPAPAAPTPVAPDAAAPDESLVTAAEDCGPGTRAAVGSTACVPVGTTTCAAGFAKDPSGWGCVAVLPEAACTGATRPALGEKACVPVGDCGGAYPPANAIIVDPSLADGAVDATHVKTLAAAIATANDGATIALVDGEHASASANLSKDVTIIGRCAEKTKVVAPPGETGIRILSRVNVRRLTFANVDTVFDVYGAAASLDLDDTVLEGSIARAVFVRNGASANLRRVVVRGTVARTPGAQTIALLAGSGSILSIEDSAVLDSFDAAIAGADDGDTHVTVTRSIVDGTTAGAIRAFEGARVDVVESLVKRAGGIAVLALHREKGYPEITFTRSVIADTGPTATTGTEIATVINAAFGAIVKLDDTTITNTKGIGIYSAETAKITLTKSVITRTTENADSSGNGVSATHQGEVTLVDSAIVDATGLGVGTFEGGKANIERSLVRTIGGAVVDGFPVGFALNALSGSNITAVDSSLVDAKELAVASSEAGTHVTLDKVLVLRTSKAKPGEYGHGILAGYDSVVDVTRSIVERQSGVALFYAAGAGTVTRSLVRGNAIGAHVQEGSVFVESEIAPEGNAALELVVTTDVQFVDNESKTGTGELPIPGGFGSKN